MYLHVHVCVCMYIYIHINTQKFVREGCRLTEHSFLHTHKIQPLDQNNTNDQRLCITHSLVDLLRVPRVVERHHRDLLNCPHGEGQAHAEPHKPSTQATLPAGR